MICRPPAYYPGGASANRLAKFKSDANADLPGGPDECLRLGIVQGELSSICLLDAKCRHTALAATYVKAALFEKRSMP